MNYWEILGIEPTVDTTVIKRAYAKKLKLNHPEDNPQGFQQLRESYETALKEAKYIKEVKVADNLVRQDTIISAINYEEEKVIIEKQYTSFKLKEVEEEKQYETPVDEFMGKAEKIYNNFFWRIDSNKWKALLEDETYWHIDIKQNINNRILTFLMDNYNLPHKVWVLLNEHFFWNEQERELYRDFPEKFIDFLLGEIYSSLGLRYDFFKEEHKCDYDEFILLRENAYYALMSNELQDAEQYLNDANELFCDDPDLIRMRGIFFLRTDNEENALRAFTHLIEVNSKEVDGYLNRAVILMKQGKINEAYYDYQKVLIILPDNASALKGIAECYIYFDKKLEAKLIYEQLVETYPYDMDILINIMAINKQLITMYSDEISKSTDKVSMKYELAKIYFEIGNFEECCKVIEQISKDKNLDSDMYLLLGRALVKQKKMKDGMENFNIALKLAQDEGKNGYEIFVEKGIVYVAVKNYDAAIKNLNLALKINQFDVDVLHNLAEAFRYKDMFEESIRLSNEAIALNPSKWVYYSTRGLSYYNLNKFEEAKKDHEVVVDHEYSFAWAWYRKGYCHLKLSEFEEAVDCFQTAMDWDDKIENEVHYHLAVALFKMGNFQLALKEIEIHIKNNPEDCLGYLVIGNIQSAMGNFEKAKDEYLMAYSINPDNWNVKKALAFCYLKDEEYERSVKYLNEMYLSYPDDEWTQLTLTWVSMKTEAWGTWRKVVEKYEKNIDKNPNCTNPYMSFYSGILSYEFSFYKEAAVCFEKIFKGELICDAWSYLSMVYYQLGDMEKAIEFAKKALEKEPSNIDYKTRYEGILKYKDQKTFLFIFNRRPSSKKMWKSTLPLKHHDLGELDVLNIDIGDNYGE